jgi:hypothetical protein
VTDAEEPQPQDEPLEAPTEPAAAAETPVPPAPMTQTLPPPAPVATSGNGFAVASLVLGIVGVVLTITFVIGLICDVLAVVFGALGRTKAREGSSTNASLATAGMILGLVGLGLLLLLVVLISVGGVHWHLMRFHRVMYRR